MAAKAPQFDEISVRMNAPLFMPIAKNYAKIVLASIAGLAAVLSAVSVLADEPASQVLRDAYDVPANAQPVARFDVAKDSDAFILDQRLQGQMLFRFERSREVFVLSRVPGPRGDVMLKNDLGVVMVRMSRVGGPVLFSGRNARGVPAWRSGPASPLGPQTVQLEDLRPSLANIANDLVAVLEHDLVISISGVDERSAWLYLDAALNARSAIMRLIRSPDRKGRILPTLNEIKISNAQEPALILEDAVLEIHLVVDQGFAGRPSSLRLAGFLSGKSTRPPKRADKSTR